MPRIRPQSVRLLKRYGVNQAGQVCGFSPEKVRELIRAGIAVAYTDLDREVEKRSKLKIERESLKQTIDALRDIYDPLILDAGQRGDEE